MHAPDQGPALPGTPTAAPVPPVLAGTFGYPGACRFVSFHWEPAGDEVVYDDGRLSGTGDGQAFLAYRRHRAVAPHLAAYNLGASDRFAEHCLVIDRQTRRAAVAPTAEARAFLDAQDRPETGLAPDGREEVGPAGWREVTVDPEAVRQALRRQQAAIARMLAFLDQWQSPRKPGTRTYTGYRDPTSQVCRVFVHDEGGGRRELPPRLDVRNHSPTGFSWGYGGSGPAQLALALACDVLGDDEEAQDVYQRLKFRLVGRLPADGWSLSGQRLLEIIRELQREAE